tara:strand:- start:234 stop:587 length:354 start_codon:yes stop_codon:yes gene_type:complete
VISSYARLKKFIFWILFIFSFTSVEAGLNDFTNLIFVDDWLIERKVDLKMNLIKCRASIPSHANWFGARVRLGADDELIQPFWISVNTDQVIDSKLTKIRELLDACRSDFLFLPENL